MREVDGRAISGLEYLAGIRILSKILGPAMRQCLPTFAYGFLEFEAAGGRIAASSNQHSSTGICRLCGCALDFMFLRSEPELFGMLGALAGEMRGKFLFSE